MALSGHRGFGSPPEGHLVGASVKQGWVGVAGVENESFFFFFWWGGGLTNVFSFCFVFLVCVGE